MYIDSICSQHKGNRKGERKQNNQCGALKIKADAVNVYTFQHHESASTP